MLRCPACGYWDFDGIQCWACGYRVSNPWPWFLIW